MENRVAEENPQNSIGGEEEEEKSNGFLRNLISNMVSEEKKDEGEEKGSGFLRNFISSMVYAEGDEENEEKEEEQSVSRETGEVGSGNGLAVLEDQGGVSESAEENGGGGNGGKGIGNMISELFHSGKRETEEKPEENVKTEEEEGGGGGGGGGGGIIDNIISHLPASLQGRYFS